MTPESARILLVDDDPIARAVLRRYLSSHGFSVSDVAGGAEALEEVRRDPFDLILLDVEMPPPGGLDVLRTLRQTYSSAELPIMMATVLNDSGNIVEALKFGANDYVTKPFDLPVVLARAQTQYNLKRAIDRARQLEQSLAQRNAQLEEANRRMHEELEAATSVQRALLPTVTPAVSRATFAWHYSPCTQLAGDLLGFVGEGERIWIYVLDVVDHGVKAALLAVMISRVLHRLLSAVPAPSPVSVAAQLNREFPWDDRTQQFFTLLVGCLDTTTREFRYTSAGQPGPLHLPREGEPQLFRVAGLPIGLGDREYEDRTLKLNQGDRLVLYTDGLPEAVSPTNGGFGDARCAACVAHSRDKPLIDSLADLVRAVDEWTNPLPPHDDISIIAVEIL